MPFVELLLAYLAGAATVIVFLFLYAAVWMAGDPEDHDLLH